MREKLDVNKYLHMTQEEFTAFLCSKEAIMNFELSVPERPISEIILEFIIAKCNLELKPDSYEMTYKKSEDGLTYNIKVMPIKKGE